MQNRPLKLDMKMSLKCENLSRVDDSSFPSSLRVGLIKLECLSLANLK
jgi:hypothetical protein